MIGQSGQAVPQSIESLILLQGAMFKIWPESEGISKNIEGSISPE